MISKGAVALRQRVNPPKESDDGVPRTQSELARRLGVTPQAVSNWVNGHGTPSMEAAAEMERIFGIPMRDWIDVAEAEEPAA